RRPKFEKACALYNATCFISDLEDTLLGEIEIKEVQNMFLPFVNQDFDFVYTHGENGEYGHVRHKDVHKAVVDAVKRKKIGCNKLFVFNYEKKNNFTMIPRKDSTKKIELSAEEIEMKRETVEKLYGYARESPDVQYCTEIEAFKEVNLQ
ncbi:MAG: hypothetical protein JW772_01975, partial [Candidatus Diapherotrites archaeon]|nr:hypothetical protein [Candidatus Diapherotrites archaeon]